MPHLKCVAICAMLSVLGSVLVFATSCSKPSGSLKATVRAAKDKQAEEKYKRELELGDVIITQLSELLGQMGFPAETVSAVVERARGDNLEDLELLLQQVSVAHAAAPDSGAGPVFVEGLKEYAGGKSPKELVIAQVTAPAVQTVREMPQIFEHRITLRPLEETQIDVAAITGAESVTALRCDLVCPSGARITEDGKQIRITAPGSDGEVMAIAIDGTSADSRAFRLNITIRVASLNLAPVYNWAVTFDVTRGVRFEQTFEASDPEGSSVLFLCTACPSGASLDPQSGTFVWVPGAASGAQASATITITDGKDTTLVELSFNIAQVNSPPVAQNIGPLIIASDALWSVPLGALDPDGDSLTYVPSGAAWPAGMTVSGAGQISWTPGRNQVGTYDLQATISDGLLSVPVAIRVTVTLVNAAPVLQLPEPPVVSVAENSQLSVVLGATDDDGDSVTFSCLGGCPAGLVISGATGELTWIPGFSDAGSYAILIGATDGKSADNQVLTVNVSNTNRAPDLTTPSNATISAAVPYAFTAVATDPDVGDTVTFSCGAPCPAGLAVSASGVLTWTPAESQSGPHSVTVIATDQSGASDSAAFTLTVEAPPVAVLSGTPPAAASSVAALNITVGGTNVSMYRYAVVDGTALCGGYGPWVSVATPISATLNQAGPLLVCVQGRTAAGTTQVAPTTHYFEKNRFRDIAQNGVTPFDTCQRGAVATGDIDDDGYTDLVSSNQGVFFNNGDMTFTQLNVWNNCGARNVMLADADNDGDLDIFENEGLTQKLIRQTGLFSGTFSAAVSFDTTGLSVNADSFVLDLNNDGYLDYVLQTNTGSALYFIYLNNRDGTFGIDWKPIRVTHVTEPMRTGGSAEYMIVTDLNNDNKLDWFGGTPANLVYNSGNFQFDERHADLNPEANGTAIERDDSGLVAGDFDNDGDNDLFADALACNICLYLNQSNSGDFVFDTSDTHLPAQRIASYQSALALADIDNDGDLDLLANYADAFGWFENSGSASGYEFSAFKAVAGRVGAGTAEGFGIFDADNDGDLDIYVSRNTDDDLFLENLTNNTHYLRVSLKGRGTVDMTPTTGTGARIAGDLMVHFGLAPAWGGGSGTYTLKVYWPSGQVSTVPGVVPTAVSITKPDAGPPQTTLSQTLRVIEPPAVRLLALPRTQTSDTSLRVHVRGEGVTDYRWAYRDDGSFCPAPGDASYEVWSPVSADLLVASLGGLGNKRLCVYGRDGSGLEQAVVTEHAFTTVSPPAESPAFTNVTAGFDVPRPSGTYQQNTVIAYDFDQDGYTDLGSTKSGLYLNFGPAGSVWGATPHFSLSDDLGNPGDTARHASIGDFDADGELDVAVMSSTGFFSLKTINGDLGNKYTMTGADGSGGAVMVDINRDGYLDVVQPSNLSVPPDYNVWINVPADATELDVVSLDPGNGTQYFSSMPWSAAQEQFFAFDINNDGLVDFGGPNDTSLAFGTRASFGTNSYTMSVFAPGGSAFRSDYGLTWGDFNGDGRFDVVLGDTTNGNLTLLMNTTATGAAPAFTDASATWTGSDPVGQAAFSSGDFDLDGRTDLLVNGDTSIQIYGNSGGTSFAAPLNLFSALASNVNRLGVVALDYDNDGDLDFFADRDNGDAQLFRNDTNSLHFLKVEVFGDPARKSPRLGGGTRLELRSADGDTLHAIREVSHNTAGQAQGDLIQHFGLPPAWGGAYGAYQVAVQFPSGFRTTYDGVVPSQLQVRKHRTWVNQLLQIDEANNLITNGAFEGGTTVWEDQANNPATLQSTTVRSGAGALEFLPPEQIDSTAFAVQPNTTYQVAFDVRAELADEVIDWGLWNFDAGWSNFQTENRTVTSRVGSWTRVSINFTTPANSAYMSLFVTDFSVSNGAQKHFIDNAEVRRVP